MLSTCGLVIRTFQDLRPEAAVMNFDMPLFFLLLKNTCESDSHLKLFFEIILFYEI